MLTPIITRLFTCLAKQKMNCERKFLFHRHNLKLCSVFVADDKIVHDYDEGMNKYEIGKRTSSALRDASALARAWAAEPAASHTPYTADPAHRKRARPAESTTLHHDEIEENEPPNLQPYFPLAASAAVARAHRLDLMRRLGLAAPDPQMFASSYKRFEYVKRRKVQKSESASKASKTNNE